MFIVKTFSGCLGVPLGIGSDHRVEDNEKFSHAGNEDHFGEFALSFQSISKLTNHWVVPASRQGRHVQYTSYSATPAKDRSFTSELPAVPVERRDANQCRDLLAVELSQFGQFGDQRCRRRHTDTGRALKEFRFSFPLVIRFHQPGDLLIDRFDFFDEVLHDLLQALLHDLGGGLVRAILLGRPQSDELPSSSDQLVEFVLFFVSLRERSWPDKESKAGDDASINAVRFGENSKTFG